MVRGAARRTGDEALARRGGGAAGPVRTESRPSPVPPGGRLVRPRWPTTSRPVGRSWPPVATPAARCARAATSTSSSSTRTRRPADQVRGIGRGHLVPAVGCRREAQPGGALDEDAADAGQRGPRHRHVGAARPAAGRRPRPGQGRAARRAGAVAQAQQPLAAPAPRGQRGAVGARPGRSPRCSSPTSRTAWVACATSTCCAGRWPPTARTCATRSKAPMDELAAPAEMLLTVRCELHRLTGRNMNVLLLEDQDAVADAMGFADADVFMRRVAGAARAIDWASARFWRRVERLISRGRQQRRTARAARSDRRRAHRRRRGRRRPDGGLHRPVARLPCRRQRGTRSASRSAVTRCAPCRPT